MYAIVRAVLLKSMGIAAPEQLAVMWPEFNGTPGEFSYNTYRDLRRRSTSFDGIALTGSANWPIPIPFEVNGRDVHVTMCVASGNFFDVLGARPSLGRTFVEDDDRPGAPPVTVLSDRFWRATFAGDASVIGRTLGGSRIIGVMPPEFFYPSGADVWTPAARVLGMTAKDQSPAALTQVFDSLGAFHLVGRPRWGVSIAVAQAEITRVWLASRTFSTANASGANTSALRISLTPLLDHVFGTARRALWLLMGSVGLVLLIACANVAGLLVARNAARTRELAVRAALGATRWHLMRQHVADALVLASAGGTLGVVVAVVALPLLVRLSPTAIVRLSDTHLDFSVAAVAIAVTAIAMLIVGTIPAAQLWSSSALQRMKSTSTGETQIGLRRKVRAGLIVAQVALTLVLFVCGTLTFKSVRRLAAVDLGYQPDHVVSADISQLDQTRYAGYEALLRATDDILGRLSALPRVQSAAAVLTGPFAHGSIGWDTVVLLEGQPDTPATWLAGPTVNVECVSPRYFETMGIRLLRGRDFTTGDRADAPRVVIVSDALAAHFWPGQNPIGKRLRNSLSDGGPNKSARWQTVVGVVRAARYREMDRYGTTCTFRWRRVVISPSATSSCEPPAMRVR